MPRKSKFDNVIQAMEYILTALHKSGLTATAIKKATPAINYVMKTLNVTQMQSIFISMLCDAGRALDYSQFSSFLGCHRLRLISYDNELQELVKKGITNRIPSDYGEDDYIIRAEAMISIQKNEAYVRPSTKDLSFDDFLGYFHYLMEKKSNGNITYGNFMYDINELISNNKALPLVNEIKKLNLEGDDMMVLLTCVHELLAYNATTDNNDLTKFISSRQSLRCITNQLKQGTHTLIESGIISHSFAEGFLSMDSYEITDEGKALLFKDYITESNTKQDNRRGLRLHEDIKKKTLFYNPNEEQQINRLADLLKEENFKGIQQRLEQNGMRKGFSCLFYGAPGTGKTETVLQLAKMTGRDIFEVNIAGMRDKYVGDSEKNIKAVFTRYRKLCNKCDIAPILLFNEADAIINKRVENVQDSVDKMDNAMQNIILNELEQLDGILIATTNLTSNLDDAFERRFLYKVEFKKPTAEVKSSIWKSVIPDISNIDADILAHDYDFSGGEIENVSRKLTVDNILYGKKTTLKQLREYCDNENIAKKKKNERSKVSGFGKVA